MYSCISIMVIILTTKPLRKAMSASNPQYFCISDHTNCKQNKLLFDSNPLELPNNKAAKVLLAIKGF